jgi:hypothetical protein
MTVTFSRELLGRARGRLSPFDFHVLVGLALAVDPVRHELTGPWDALGQVLGLAPVILRPVLERLAARGFLAGRFDAPDGVHVHFAGLIAPRTELPPNLPLEAHP